MVSTDQRVAGVTLGAGATGELELGHRHKLVRGHDDGSGADLKEPVVRTARRGVSLALARLNAGQSLMFAAAITGEACGSL